MFMYYSISWTMHSLKTEWLNRLWMLYASSFFYLRHSNPFLLTRPLPNLVSWIENCGHILDVVSLERFEVFHLGTKRSQVLTDVVSPSLLLGGNPPNPSWQFEWIFYHFPQACSVCVSKSISKLEHLLSFMSLISKIFNKLISRFSWGTIFCPLSSHRPRCRAVLCAR